MRKILSLSTKPLAVAFISSILFSGCLVTRTQLKQDGSDQVAQPAHPAKIQEVQPQGQYVIDEIKSEMTRLTGRIEDLERSQKEAPSGGSEEHQKALEKRIQELEQSQIAILEALKKLQDSGTSATVDPMDQFEKGLASFEAKNFDAAVEAFSNYLKSPKAKGAVERATYLRGEAYYQLKQYKKAIVDYSKVTERFTKSKFLPSSLYKIGLSFEALGMKEDAKSFYQELVDKHPNSQEARLVRAKLK